MSGQTMIERSYEISRERAKHAVWIISDLQQRDPEKAKRCLDLSMADFEGLGSPAQAVWYLGDAVESDNLEYLELMSAMQAEAFRKTGLPLCYATGNHDYDYARSHPEKAPAIPFYETVQREPGWFTTQDCEDFWFSWKLGEYSVFFLCDHIARDNSWRVTHGKVQAGEDRYPYVQSDIDALRRRIAAVEGPVITASHYSFTGGNRESDLLGKLLPLPGNVRIHVYGHAHIGDFKWARENAWRRISWVDWHDIPQINVSSFENVRGSACRSVLLHVYEDGGMGVFFRNHDKREFTESYFPSRENMGNGFDGREAWD
jgi:hypothetical protein